VERGGRQRSCTGGGGNKRKNQNFVSESGERISTASTFVKREGRSKRFWGKDDGGLSLTILKETRRNRGNQRRATGGSALNGESEGEGQRKGNAKKETSGEKERQKRTVKTKGVWLGSNNSFFTRARQDNKARKKQKGRGHSVRRRRTDVLHQPKIC